MDVDVFYSSGLDLVGIVLIGYSLSTTEIWTGREELFGIDDSP